MDEILKKYKNKMIKEAVLKALMYALFIAFTVLSVTALIFWIVNFKLYWLLFIIFALSIAIATPLLYFFYFRPTKKDVAKRVDSVYGLDERMLTMTELSVNSSAESDVMVQKQRQDTVGALHKVNAKKFPITVFSLITLIGVPISLVFGLGLTTISTLSAYNVIPSGIELFTKESDDTPQYVTITYRIEGKGKILGVSEEDGVLKQTLQVGDVAPSVWATVDKSAEGEWYFTGWSDGVSTPYRSEHEVTESITLTAKFSNGIDSAENYSAYDEPVDLPYTLQETGGDTDGDYSNDGGEDEGGSLDSDESSSAGQYKSSNQIIDGNTYYGGTTYTNYRDEAMEELDEDDEIPEDVKDVNKWYYDIIKK